MKIKSIESFIRDLVLTKPYTIAYKTISTVENVFLLVTLENGMVGIGAANPDAKVVGETPKDVLNNCLSETCQLLIGRDIHQFKTIISEIAGLFPRHPGTVAIWDIALHDAYGKLMNKPVLDLYGRKVASLPTSVTIGIMDVDDTLREAKELSSLGFRILKIKTGHSVKMDVERIIRVREQHPDCLIRVDFNQGYTLEDLKKFLESTRSVDLELIEQPVKVGEESSLSHIAPEERKIFAADESLKNSQSARQFAAAQPLFGIYNIKLMKCGGLLSAFEIGAIAKSVGIKLFWGCNDESAVSITAALHAAYCCENTRYIDLDGSFDLAEDLVTGGFELKNGLMYPSSNPGFGVDLI